MLTLGAVGTGLAFAINLRNIRLTGASAASTVTYLTPVFAVLIGVVVLDEHLAWHQPVGALIVLAGVAVAQGLFADRFRHRRASTTPAVAGATSTGASPTSPADGVNRRGRRSTPTDARSARR